MCASTKHRNHPNCSGSITVGGKYHDNDNSATEANDRDVQTYWESVTWKNMLCHLSTCKCCQNDENCSEVAEMEEERKVT